MLYYKNSLLKQFKYFHQEVTNLKEGLLPIIKITPYPHEMKKFEEQKILKSRSVVKKKLKDWYDLVVGCIPKPIKSAVSKAY